MKQIRERGFWSETFTDHTLIGNAIAYTVTTQILDSGGMGILATVLPSSLHSGAHTQTLIPAGLVLSSRSVPQESSTVASFPSGVDAYAVEMGLAPTSKAGKEFKYRSLVFVGTDADHKSLTTKLTSAREGDEPVKVLFVGKAPEELTCGEDEVYTLDSTSFEILQTKGYSIATVQIQR